MITRMFRVKVHEHYVTEFEKAYKEVSMPLVKSQRGFISLSTGRPLTDKNLEYVMISYWENLESLQNFVGENWEKALIPDGMEKFMDGRNLWMNVGCTTIL